MVNLDEAQKKQIEKSKKKDQATLQKIRHKCEEQREDMNNVKHFLENEIHEVEIKASSV